MVPEWLRAHTTPDWVDRYGLRASEFRLPKSHAKRQAWAERIGADGRALLIAVYADTAPADLRMLSAIAILRQVWVQNFVLIDDRLRWRDNDNTPPAGPYIRSPSDTDAQHGPECAMHWNGSQL